MLPLKCYVDNIVLPWFYLSVILNNLCKPIVSHFITQLNILYFSNSLTSFLIHTYSNLILPCKRINHFMNKLNAYQIRNYYFSNYIYIFLITFTMISYNLTIRNTFFEDLFAANVLFVITMNFLFQTIKAELFFLKIYCTFFIIDT